MRIRLKPERLAQELARRPISLNRWAQTLGLGSGHLSELVNGRRPYPAARTRKKLLQALDVELDDLFEIEMRPPRPARPPKPTGFSNAGSPPPRRRPPIRRLPMRMLPLRGALQDLRYAARSLRHRPGWSAATVLVLAVGLGANIALFVIVHATHFRSYAYPEADRLYTVRAAQEDRRGALVNLSFAEYLDYAEQGRDVLDLAIWDWEPFSLAGGDRPLRVAAGQVSANFREVVGVPMIKGRWFTEEERRNDEDVLVLGETLWRTSFGADPAIVGRSVELNGSDAIVIGVAAHTLDIPDGARMWVPLSGGVDDQPRSFRWLLSIGRLRDGVSEDEARAGLETIADRLRVSFPESNEAIGITLTSLRDDRVGSLRGVFLSTLAVVVLLLILVCANVATLLLSRPPARAPELAVRTALGASGARLARQVLLETALLGALGLLLGLAIASSALQGLSGLMPDGTIPTWIDASPDATIALFALTVTAITVGLSALLPAFRAARQPRLSRQRQGLGGSYGARRARAVLVVSQVALTAVLVTGAGLTVRSLLNLNRVDPGFEPEGTLMVGLDLLSLHDLEPAERAPVFRRYYRRFQQIPGVETVGATSHIPLGPRWHDVEVTVDDPGIEAYDPTALLVQATPGYVGALGLALLEGEDFAPLTGAPVEPVAALQAIVSRALAERFWPDSSALGRRLRLGGPDSDQPWHEVVGVVSDVRHFGLDREVAPTLYVSAGSQSLSRSFWMLRSSTLPPEQLALDARAAVEAIDAAQPVYQVMPLATHVGRSLWLQRFLVTNFLTFSAIGLVLAAAGLYAVMSYTVALRRGEIGVRLALGAPTRAIVRKFTVDGLRLVAIGLAIGVPLAILAGRGMAALLFGVTAGDPSILGVAVLLVVGAGLLAAFVPARAAAHLDPVETLATE